MAHKSAWLGREPGNRNRDEKFNCIKKTSFAEDGTPIIGHSYVTEIAFQDLDSKRWYFMDKCAKCGTCTVGFTDGEFANEADYYPQVTEIGGH